MLFLVLILFVLLLAPGSGCTKSGAVFQSVGTTTPMGSTKTDVGDITLLTDPANTYRSSPGQNEDTHGYAEHRITLVNHSSTAGHRVTLTIPARVYGGSYWGHYLQSMKRSVEVGPGEQSSVTLYQPNLSFGYSLNNLGVEIDGRLVRDPIPLPLPSRGDRNYPYFPGIPSSDSRLFSTSILTGLGLMNVVNTHAYKSAVGNPRPPAPGRFPTTTGTYKNKSYTYIDSYFFREARVDSWSRHWLAMSNHDGLVLHGTELQAAPPEITTAIRHYVECGGSLLLLGPCPLPPTWERTRTEHEGLVCYYPGFGQCMVTQEMDVSKWEPEQWHPITVMWEQSGQPWQDVQTPDEANRRFPVVDNLRIPVRSLFVVMLLFSILIGPVNIYILTRARRRIWLLWTVPGFSLLTCAGVAGYMLLSEGWQGQVRIEGVTVLDETAQRASSVGWLGVYTPLMPADGLHFNKETDVSPHIRVPPRTYRSGAPRTIDWTEDQHLRTGWVTARVPAHFLVRSSESRSEHLHVEKEPDGSLSVVNALGAPVRTLWMADAKGQVYTATEIPGDGSAMLRPTGVQTAARADSLRRAFAQDWLLLVDALSAKPEEYLLPGSYLAVMDSAPFFQQGLRSAVQRRSRSVVIGIMKPQ